MSRLLSAWRPYSGFEFESRLPALDRRWFEPSLSLVGLDEFTPDAEGKTGGGGGSGGGGGGGRPCGFEVSVVGADVETEHSIKF